MSYMIRKAEKEDLPRIYEIYETARQFMRENGNHAQWEQGTDRKNCWKMIFLREICMYWKMRSQMKQ